MALTIHDEMFFNAAILAYKEILDSADAPATCVLSDNQADMVYRMTGRYSCPIPLSPIRLVTPSASFARSNVTVFCAEERTALDLQV